MLKNKTLNFGIASVFMLVFLMSAVSAFTVLSITNTTTIPSTINHGEEITIGLEVKYTGSSSDTTITLTWSGENPSDISFWTLPTTTVFTKDIPTPVTFKFSIPQNYQPGIINAKLRVDGAGGTPDDFDFSIEVNKSPSLKVELITPLTKTQNGTINVTNNGNVDLTNVKLEIVSGSDDFSVNFGSITSPLIAGDDVEVEVSSTDAVNLDFSDDNTITIRAIGTHISTQINSSQLTLEVPVLFCDCANDGNLNIKDIDFSVEKGFGPEDNEWYPLDEIEVKVKLENNGKWDVDDIEIEVCLLDKKTGECVMDEDDMDLSDDDFDLEEKGEDDEKIITLSFKIDPDDLNKDSNDYELYVKATGEINDNDAGDLDGEKTCVSNSKKIEIRTDEKFIIIDNFDFPETIQCGGEVQITADVWNVGDEKIDADDIYIRIYNSKLGISEVIDFGEDIGALDYEKLEFTFSVPSDLEEGWQTLSFTVYDDKDLSDNDIYENSENDEARYSIFFKVEGNCAVAKASVTADYGEGFERGGQAGKPLVIKATVINTGDKTTTYLLNAAGYAEWASAATLDKNTLTLEPGKSEEVLLTFQVKKEALGEKLFDFEVLSENELIISKQILVKISKKGIGITGGIISGENWYLWGIGALNVILVILIIIIAVRIARK